MTRLKRRRFLMRARRKLGPDEKDNFGIVTPDAITGLRDRIFGTVFIVAMGVPAIALIVGRHRDHEYHAGLGHGANQRDRAAQIAGSPASSTSSSSFCLKPSRWRRIGGAVGIFLAWIVGKIVTATFFPTYLSIFAILGALAASGGMGIISGIVPAWKAARLDPIEALRAD